MTEEVIPGFKIIRHNAGRVSIPDDPSFPFKLVANFIPPQFMDVAFAMMYGGSEEIVIRSMKKETLDAFVVMHELRTHTRLRRITITGPDGFKEEFKGRNG